MIELVRVIDLKVGDVVLANDVRPGGSTRGVVLERNRIGSGGHVVVDWPGLQMPSLVHFYRSRGPYVATRPELIRREVLDR